MTVSKSFEDYMADLKAQTAHVDNPVEGDLIVGDPVAIKTRGFWCIGAVCFEYLDGGWIAQPYDRYSVQFLTKDDAIAFWKSDGEWRE